MGCSWSGWPVEDVALGETVMVEVRDGVTMGGGGGVTATLPPPQPEMANVIQNNAAENTPQRTRRLLRAGSWSARRFLPRTVNKRKSRASTIDVGRGTCEIGGMRGGADGGNWAGPLVVTLTVNVAGPLASETPAGTWQRAPRGAPLQVNQTVPVKRAPAVS